MAKSHYEYVKIFELSDVLLPKCWPVIRLDGRGFHRFSDSHAFNKPNDDRSLNLMSKAAAAVMMDFKDIVLAYGQSDEYSFVFNKNTAIYNRRESKILSTIVSMFTSCFVFHWTEFFPTTTLLYPPAFDGRVVLYPSRRTLRDYLCWRQVDCHVNNLYNTVFWSLVQHGGMKNQEAQQRLKGTNAGEKNEILFSQFKVNYNDMPELYRKGTVITRALDGDQENGICIPQNVDIIRDTFWNSNPEILGKDDE